MKLLKLAPSQRVQGRWLLHLEDASLLRVGENEVVSFGLYAGMELSGERLEELRAAAALGELKERAISALSLRPLSRRELVQKLTARPRPTRDGKERKEKAAADPAAAEAVADWLEELGYLNDAEYAKSVVRHYSAKGYGERKLRDELYRRGVPRDCWEEALAEAQDPEDEIDQFIRRKMRGEDPRDPRALKRTSDALARRGYRWEEIKEGLERYGAAQDDE